jgi:hypothetical protein
MVRLPNHDPIDGTAGMIVWLVPMTFLAWANHAIPRFYARRFGRVVRNGRWERPDWRFMLWLASGLVLLARHTSPAIFWIVWLSYPLYIVFTAWPYRLQHLLVAAAAAYAISRHVAAGGRLTNAEAFFDVYLIAIALVVAGLLDHLVLARALASSDGRPAAASEEPAYDPDPS